MPAAAVAHGVGVFAVDEWLVGIALQILLDARDPAVHVGMHVRRVRIARIIRHALVMHQARRVFPTIILAQFVEVFAAPAFVAARPEQDARVILVTLQHRPAARQHCLLPLRAVVRHHPVVHRLPRAVRLNVRFVDDVQPIFVAQAVNSDVFG